jgi:hypothetical protein
MSLDEAQFETALKEFTEVGGVHHEAFRSNFVRAPELKEKFDALFKSRWPEPPPGPPPNPASQPPAGNTSPEGQGENVRLNDASENLGIEERRIAEQHLIQTLGASEAGSTVASAREVFNSLVDKTHTGDQAFLGLLESVGLGNDPELIVHLAGLKGKLSVLGPSLDAVALSKMSPDERLSRAVASAVAILGPLDSPFVKRLERLFPDEQSQSEILDFLASKNFR